MELILADMESLERQIQKLEKKARSNDKIAKAQFDLATRIQKHLEEEKPARALELNDEEKLMVKEFNLITIKPVLYVMNVDEAAASTGNDKTEQVKKLAESEGAQSVMLCGRIEDELATLDAAEQKEYLESLGLEEPGLNRMIRASYALLDLITFFTAGEQEVRAWTVRKGSSAPQAAGEIHSDIEKGFIRAEVTAYADFLSCGSLNAAKDAGKMRLEGKDYIVQDGDICYFRFNV
jgi:GTP-binding protein YchF